MTLAPPVGIGAGKHVIGVDYLSDEKVPSEDVPVRVGHTIDGIVGVESSDSVGREVLRLSGDDHHFPAYTLVFENDLVMAIRAQDRLLEKVASMGYIGNDLFAVRLALGEAVDNCLKHAYSGEEGYGYIGIGCSFDRGSVTLTVNDYGSGFDPSNVLNFDGKGIILMLEYMNRVNIINKSQNPKYEFPGTMVVMTRYRTNDGSFN
jgi:anti-sigma regulatory factor (Ser/Thr protein kinase)